MNRSLSTPRVSILVPVYNAGPYLAAALQSIAEQTFTDFEVLVIDDHSTDDSVAVMKAWAARDPRFHVLSNTGPNGLPSNLNFGLQAVRGEYIARMDQDDISRPTRLAEQVAFLDAHPGIELVGAAFQPFGLSTSVRPVAHPTTSTLIAWQFLTNTRFAHPSVMFRRTVVERVGSYPLQEAEDFGFFSKVVQAGPTANLPNILLDYREHGGNMSTLRREKIAHGVQATYRRNFEHYTGRTTGLEPFYHFHAGRFLPLRDLPLVASIAWQILRRIRADYHLSWWSTDWLRTVIIVKTHLLRSVVRALLRLPSLASQLTV